MRTFCFGVYMVNLSITAAIHSARIHSPTDSSFTNTVYCHLLHTESLSGQIQHFTNNGLTAIYSAQNPLADNSPWPVLTPPKHQSSLNTRLLFFWFSNTTSTCPPVVCKVTGYPFCYYHIKWNCCFTFEEAILGLKNKKSYIISLQYTELRFERCGRKTKTVFVWKRDRKAAKILTMTMGHWST